MLRKSLKYSGLIVALFLVGAQFIQPDRTNPPINSASTFEAVLKPSPQVAAIVQRACYDCHSNNTVWPWYSRVAPMSWLVADDVKKGRAQLNFSQWSFYSPDMSRTRIKEACQELRKGEMPPWYYKPLHPVARLTDSEIQTLCDATSLAP